MKNNHKKSGALIRSIGLVVLVALVFVALEAGAQRRARPGAMKHSDSEAKAAVTKSVVKAQYIKDGAMFIGDMFYAKDGAGIKICTSKIYFGANTYTMENESAKFTTTKKTKSGREYKAKEKFSEDYEASGKYEVVKYGAGGVYLILYTEKPNEIFAKIPISGTDAESFTYDEDNIICKYSYIQLK